MKNLRLQEILKEYPDDMDIKLLINASVGQELVEFTEENILHTSETAYINTEAPEDEHDTEDGKIELGNGNQYLLINPIIY